MDIQETLQKATESFGSRRVFSEPIERDGMTIILASKVAGGGGGGEGTQEAGAETKPAGKGSGLGYGFGAKPVGAFIVKGGKVRWQPVVDANRVVAGMQLVAGCALLLLTAGRRRQARALRARRLRWFARLRRR